MALQVGLTEESAMMKKPGEINDLWLWRREYDDELHGIKRKAR
jgi:hypothetical protein